MSTNTDIPRDTPIQQIRTSRTNGTNMRFLRFLQLINSYGRRYEFGDGGLGGTSLSEPSGPGQPTLTSTWTPRSNRLVRVVRMVRICVFVGVYNLKTRTTAGTNLAIEGWAVRVGAKLLVPDDDRMVCPGPESVFDPYVFLPWVIRKLE